MIIYKILTNDKTYIGQTVEPLKKRIRQHKSLLDKKEHYNKILQAEYSKNDFDFKLLFESENINKCTKEYYNFIEKFNSGDIKKGFNSRSVIFQKGKRKNNISDEDIIFLYLEGKRLIDIKEILGDLTPKTISLRLQKNGIIKKDYKDRIPTYDVLHYAIEETLLLSNRKMSSYDIMQELERKYIVSPRLKFNPKKISKYLSSRKYKIEKTSDGNFFDFQ